MQKLLIGIVVTGLLIVGLFFLLNHYIYQEKQADVLPTATDTSIERPLGPAMFEWSYREFTKEEIPYTEISLAATYRNGTSMTKTIDTVEGHCNAYEDAEIESYEGSTMVICYYAGLGRYFKIIDSGEEYLVQRRIFEEASPDYDPPLQPYETIERFES